MVNSEDFSKRLQKILEYYELTAAGFADTIEVGRSSISHILSGRNKPSLDFVLKIVQTYPEVELYWLLNGKGNFPSTSDQSLSNKTPETPILPIPEKQEPKSPPHSANQPSTLLSKREKTIQKIVIFYSDGTFDAYQN